jgi:hypothetical protein
MHWSSRQRDVGDAADDAIHNTLPTFHATLSFKCQSFDMADALSRLRLLSPEKWLHIYLFTYFWGNHLSKVQPA